MSNGVELIIASDRVKHTEHKLNSISRHTHPHTPLHTQDAKKPVTFAPSTLMNHMILAVPTTKQEKFTIPMDENQFITKTCLTTYTYHTTYLHNGSTTVKNVEKIVSNRHTEERNYLRATTDSPMGLTLSNTPELVVGIFPTTYHYYNKLRNNDLALTSSYTIVNTVTGPEDYISFLQPSEAATPLLDTNTYYSRLVPLTKSIPFHDAYESTDEGILTQVVITESIPPRGASAKLQSGPDLDVDLDVHIYATKTILTTVSYVATAAKESLSPNSHTRVIERVITDVVPSSVLQAELVSSFRQELMHKNVKNNKKVLKTLATLLSGQTLEITAVRGSRGTSSLGLNSSEVNANLSTERVSILHASTKHSTALASSAIQSDETKTETETETETEPEPEDELNPAESEIKNVYIKPLKKTPSQSQLHSPSANVEQLIGSLNLQRFRPVFNVMADLLQKNLVSRQKTQQTKQISSTSEAKNPLANKSQSQDTLEGPNYIPLQIVNQQHKLHNWNLLSSRYRPDNKSTDNANENEAEVDVNLSKSAHSLHINPPELIDDIQPSVEHVIDDNWPQQQQQHNNIYRDYIHFLRPPTLPAGYHHSLLNNGIPIRPGEIINANADVIIGKPNGISLAHYSRPDYPNLSNYASLQPTKKQFWIPSMIPLSLIPPQIIMPPPADNHDDYNTITMLRPPLKVSQTYSKYTGSSVAPEYLLQSRPGLVASVNHLRSPTANNKVNHIYGSEQQQIANLNSELNNNEILEIRQIPQIFSTKIRFENSQYTPGIPSIQPLTGNAHQQHQQINFKLNVLSHNVNMNAPPLTFKRDNENENENFPVASETAIQGHIAAPPMPLVKIPLNQAHVEVRLTPQSTQLAVELPPHSHSHSTENEATFKQRNQNLSKTFDGQVAHPPNSPDHYYSKLRKPNRNLFYFNTTSMSVHTHQSMNASEDLVKWMDSNPMATNKQLVYLKIKQRNSTNLLDKLQDDQATDYTNYNLKKNHNFSSRNTSQVSYPSKPDWQSFKTLGLGQPFIKPIKPDPPLTELRRGSTAIGVSNIPKKLYLATGEGFNLRSQLMSEFIRPFATTTSTHEAHIDSYATLLSPPPVPTHSKSSAKNTLTYETELNTLGLQPPPPPPPSSASVDDHFSSILSKTTPSLTTTVIPQVKAQRVSNSNGLSTGVRNSTITETISHQYSAINIKPVIMPMIHETTLKTNIMFSHNKLSTESKYSNTRNLTRKIIRPALTSKVELSLLSTHAWRNATINLPVNATLSQSPSSRLLLESSEVLLPTGISINFAIESIDSKLLGVTNQSDFIENISTTTVQQSLFETKSKSATVSTKKELSKHSIATTTSPILVLNREASIVTSHSKNLMQPTKTKSSGFKSYSRILPSAPIKHKKPSSESSNRRETISKKAPTTSTMTKNIRPDVSSILVVMSKVAGNENEQQLDNNVLDIDYDSNISIELPARDEEVEPRPNSNSVLLGGVVLATDSPYKTQSSSRQLTDACHPSCKSSKNEICVQTSSYGSRCECRLGFARIFPDRPCKPTYTYELSIPASRIGSYFLKFDNAFLNNSSSQYRHLSSVILDAIDRMVMQSDFRDEYYGVQLIEFTAASDGAVIGKFLLQLSENSDENRLETVFKKYLRRSNYSIGGTELYTSKDHLNSLTIHDFNECGNSTFNDCSIHAQCFNLVGSYTCICPDGYADISENPIYPGRHCSDKLIGCDKCNYHGNCVLSPNGTAVCECFAWYTGVTCQLNLKILFICLVVIVTVFVVLLVCMLFIYARRKVHSDALTRPIFITATNYHHPSLLTASSKITPGAFYHERSIDKHAILNDSNSDSSHISEPYVFKKLMDMGSTAKTAQISKRSNSGRAVNKFRDHRENKTSSRNTDMTAAEQLDRSLTVMIPRARYFHPNVLPQVQLTPHQMSMDDADTQSKSKPATKRPPSQQNSAYNDNNTSTTTAGDSSSELPQKNGGALVSAGFEVSAIVSDRGTEPNEPPSGQQCQQQVSRTNLDAIFRSGEEIQRMSSWMSNMQTNAISADVRSFDETTVQAVTKSMHLCFDMQTQSTTNEEPNTMTERDLGSTFLLPHTHLYMPEKLESELSGFDSI